MTTSRGSRRDEFVGTCARDPLGGRRARPVPGRLGWRTFPAPRCHALIGAAITRNPRAAAKRLCVARGAGSCVGRPALEPGASTRAAHAFDGGPRWGVLVEAPRAL